MTPSESNSPPNRDAVTPEPVPTGSWADAPDAFDPTEAAETDALERFVGSTDRSVPRLAGGRPRRSARRGSPEPNDW